MSDTFNGRTNGVTILKVVCATVFCLFSFVYLYCYQADILYASQHGLSNGSTKYNSLIGAVVLTVVLYLLQRLANAIVRTPDRYHALSYLPSYLFLTVLTSAGDDMDKGIGLGAWWWVVPLLLVLWGGVVYVLRQVADTERISSSELITTPVSWKNLLTVGCMMLFTGLFSNNNDVFHYRMRAERCILKGDYACALSSGSKSTAKDSSLTMLRAYALSCTDQLGDSLFTYPLCGGSKVLLPNGVTTKSIIVPKKVIERHYKQKKYHADYELTALLLDKRIDEFASAVGKYYILDSNLPRHYREALVLYTHLRSNPKAVFHDPVMDADYQDMLAIQRTTADIKERESLVRDTYGNTYWCYFLYSK